MALTFFVPGVGDITLVPTWPNAGAPTNNVTFLGVAKVGDLLSDTTNAQLYVCSVSTATAITWVQYTRP
jgi:hypothetical protein